MEPLLTEKVFMFYRGCIIYYRDLGYLFSFFFGVLVAAHLASKPKGFSEMISPKTNLRWLKSKHKNSWKPSRDVYEASLKSKSQSVEWDIYWQVKNIPFYIKCLQVKMFHFILSVCSLLDVFLWRHTWHFPALRKVFLARVMLPT